MSSEDLNETEHVNKNPKKFYSEENNEQVEISQNNDSKYPKIVFLIIANEFCERFSYYGLRTILFIYLTNFIKLDQNSAIALYHAFTVLCYFTPVIGAIIADGYLGLYRTILFVSIVYAIGEVILTLTSMIPLGAPNLAGPIIALIIIAAGTGGIKPCVSAFGGNQFKPSQKKYLETFFSIFYLSINIGSTIGTILTPIFRNDVKCFGNDCYPLAFGVPALFMITSIVIFTIGTPFYNRQDQSFKEDKNIIAQTLGCFYTAIKNKIKLRKSETKEHWLDFAETKYSKELISDVKAFYKVLIVFLPLPVFWALYDQQGSRWTAQAQQLSGRIGSFTIKPDQFQAINPVFIVVLVPLFDFVIYPFFTKFNFLKNQLQRMSIGLIFAILAFIIAAILESQMQKASATLNPINRIKILNLSPCNISIISNDKETVLSSVYMNNKLSVMSDEVIDKILKNNKTVFKLNSVCKQGENTTLLNGDLLTIKTDNFPKTLVLYFENNKIKSLEYAYDINKQLIGFSQVKLAKFKTKNLEPFYPVLFNKINQYDSSKFEFKNIESEARMNSINPEQNSTYTAIDFGDYTLQVKNKNGDSIIQDELTFETCARYTILFYSNELNSSNIDYIILTDIHPNGLHMAWQIIQIFVMTIGEVMFSISGLSFAYSQAPITMKSVLQALWCLTVAFGNLIVVIVAEAKFVQNQVYEYLLFAGLLLVATIVFMILAWFYKFRENDNSEENKKSDGIQEEKTKEKGISNPTYHKYSTDSEVKLDVISSLEPN